MKMKKWIERRRAAKAESQARYWKWYAEEIRLYGHVRSYDETQGWCISDRCFKTAPHLPHYKEIG